MTRGCRRGSPRHRIAPVRRSWLTSAWTCPAATSCGPRPAAWRYGMPGLVQAMRRCQGTARRPKLIRVLSGPSGSDRGATMLGTLPSMPSIPVLTTPAQNHHSVAAYSRQRRIGGAVHNGGRGSPFNRRSHKILERVTATTAASRGPCWFAPLKWRPLTAVTRTSGAPKVCCVVSSARWCMVPVAARTLP